MNRTAFSLEGIKVNPRYIRRLEGRFRDAGSFPSFCKPQKWHQKELTTCSSNRFSFCKPAHLQILWQFYNVPVLHVNNSNAYQNDSSTFETNHDELSYWENVQSEGPVPSRNLPKCWLSRASPTHRKRRTNEQAWALEICIVTSHISILILEEFWYKQRIIFQKSLFITLLVKSQKKSLHNTTFYC